MRVGRRILSKILIAGHNRETGRNEVDSCVGLLGFKRGMIVEVFQMAGISQEVMERLKRFVRYSMPLSPRCLRWRSYLGRMLWMVLKL